MRRAIQAIAIVLLILPAQPLASPSPVHAASKHLGWDLTYRSVLLANNVARGEWLEKWLKDHKGGPIRKILESWKNGPIVSAILLDVPAPHAGERVQHLLVRTDTAAYAWVYTDGKAEESQQKLIDASLFDELVSRVASWGQAAPLSEEKAGEDIPAGYFGFLSIYQGGEPRQMLLTFEDFYLPGDHGWENPNDGRVLVAFGPLAKSYE